MAFLANNRRNWHLSFYKITSTINYLMTPLETFTCSKSTIETLQKGVKNVNNKFNNKVNSTEIRETY